LTEFGEVRKQRRAWSLVEKRGGRVPRGELTCGRGKKRDTSRIECGETKKQFESAPAETERKRTTEWGKFKRVRKGRTYGKSQHLFPGKNVKSLLKQILS